ncbi:tigger transposable element-derived protein 4-like [Portunus trituberculatus]|uniref:tigger transposable element-derived protein 4-like n=1 Tax=Portunus trituberculatus TaxID=210409 RepID=UPI001E1CD0AF|nr:tigger transposable element-derived protein 4-like [Portunus trituberculatus]XP_045109652.1 tigger transposable element-derived protein 4-like [Portunus trituberculatus]XP_045109653.1 tigger transposable element-derived protein 4-like [Portunus trituberculatus]
MDTQPFENMVMKTSEPPVLAASHNESSAVELKAENQDSLGAAQNREEEEEEEEEIQDQKEPRKKVRRGRAKAKRKGRTQQSLALANAQVAAAAFTFMRKRRQDLTLGAKVKVLEMLEQEPKVPQGKIASMFRVSQSQVSRIMKNKEAIMTQWNRFATPDRKRCRLGKAGALEQKLVEWYKEAKKEDLPISGPILMEKAKSIGNEMGIDFKPSAGWLGRWKDRNGVTLKRFKDKDGALSVTKVGNHWRRYMFTKATKDYSPQNVWVVDETVLAYDALPEHSIPGAVSGTGKISIILACNLAGTERKPPVVIGNSQTLTSVNLPTPFQHHPESTVTLDFFSSWLKEWDRELHTKRKKIVVLMSKTPHHPENPHVFNINVTFFPQDTSTVLQPMQLGIINVFKSLYRYQQLKYVMARTQAGEKIGLSNMFSQNILSAHSLCLSLVDAIFMVHRAWKHVSPETIVKGVVKAGMSKDVDALNVCDHVQAPPGVSQEDFEVLINMDERLSIAEHTEHQPQTLDCGQPVLTDSVQFPQHLNMYGNSGNKTQQPNPQIDLYPGTVCDYPSVSEAVYACQILRHYLQKQSGKLYDEFSDLESSIHLDMILDARPDLRNSYQPDPLHDSSSVHSLEAHQAALEQKTEYLQKMQDELHQQKIQKEMKKVTQSPVTFQNSQGSLNTLPEEIRTDLHSQLLGIHRSAMPSQDLPRQEMLRQEVHHPMQHPDFMRQDVMRPEYRQEIHQDRCRAASLVELRSFKHAHADVRDDLRNDGKNDSMTLTSELNNLSPDNHPGADLHHHVMDLDHNVRLPDGRLNNPGIPYYTLTNPLPHYMQSK